jgi:molybdenum cofactor cytidylyltransferase
MIVGVLLAAGAGSRFGSDKLLHRLADGTPIAVASAIRLRAACTRVVAVVRPGSDELARLLRAQRCEVIECAQAGNGMGHTLAAAVSASSDADGWLVALADMPFIAARSYQAVIELLYQGAQLAAIGYQGKRGHPVGFAARWLPDLLALTGDQGARTLLSSHSSELVWRDGDDAGVLRDIDRPADLSSEKT